MKDAGVTKVEMKPKDVEGATVEEIDDDEAKKIEALAELKKKQQEAKAAGKDLKPKKEDGEEADEKDNLK